VERAAGRGGGGCDGRRGTLFGCGKRVIAQREGKRGGRTSVFHRVAYLVGYTLR